MSGSASAQRWTRAVLAAVFAVSTWGFWLSLDDYPPWLDFDSATLGIFVNNVSFHDDYAHGFRDSPVDQERYRADWAAEFLPASTALSALQRLLGLPPDRVDDLLEVVALLLAALGSACVAAVLLRPGRASVVEAMFTIGLLASLPAFLLYLRTTQPHFLFSFLMFWLAVASIDRYLDSGSRRALAALALAVALYVQVPYVPLLLLPATGILLAAARGRIAACLRDAALCSAALASAALAACLQYAVAVAYEPSWAAWSEKAWRFLAARSRHASPGGSFDASAFVERLTKLWHQHFFHAWDNLGDRTRNDHLWTLPEAHVAWLLLLPVVLLGVRHAWRTRDRAAEVFAAVLLPAYAFALTFGMPEGRYLLTAVPALAWFTLCGLRAIGVGRTWYPLLLAAVLLATTVESFVRVRGAYNEAASRRWQAMAGMRETLALVRRDFGADYGRSRALHLAWPGLRYEPQLYLRMLANQQVLPFSSDTNLAELAPGEPLFAVAGEDAEGELRAWTSRGFREAGRVADGPTGRRFVVLVSLP